ncbi:MAG TPA: type III-B CRISPR-associated protein Cas10/Cmr2, partial [Campylobacterales bacterium]|nr:type III-B CRISPR-associated protein Cas10/Cmr2 [Campylobacterales bacterium]
YICLVQADGDNMGKVLEEIGADNKKLSDFSKALFDFCLEATSNVSNFNGKMIYAGGDDLFFFAPVVSGEKTIFNLCNDLSKIFDEKMKYLNLKESFPSLSFGVSITYYKFPLYEARENGVKLLFDKAKSKQKNAIAFRVIKHSGQTFESVIRKDEKVLFEKFLEITQFNDSFDSNFLHSIYTKIDRFKTIIEEIASLDNKRVRIKNFFDNNFNETEHKKYREFFESLTDFIVVVYESKIEDKLNFIYSSLRFKKFLLGDKE